MSDVEASVAQESQAADQVGAGRLLKQAREACGLHIAALAVLLKVPVKKLEALEAERFDLLPDAVFVRALASSVCRTLKIDAAPVLSRLPQTDAPKLTYQGVGINAPFRSPSDGPGPSVWTQVSKPAVLAGLLLVLGALVLVFLPAIKTSVNDAKSEVTDSRLGASAVAANTLSKSSADSPDGQKSTPLVATSANEPTSSAASTSFAGQTAEITSAAPTLVAVPSPTVGTKFTATASIPVALSSTNAIGSSSPTFIVTPNTVQASDVVVFTAKGQSWVEVTDAKNQVVLRRVLNPGEVAGAAGALPLKAVVGRANETQVQIRGKVFDLTAVAKDNVARFEVR